MLKRLKGKKDGGPEQDNYGLAHGDLGDIGASPKLSDYEVGSRKPPHDVCSSRPFQHSSVACWGTLGGGDAGMTFWISACMPCRSYSCSCLRWCCGADADADAAGAGGGSGEAERAFSLPIIFPIESRNRKNSNGLAMWGTGRFWLRRERDADIDGWERWWHARRVCMFSCVCMNVFLCVYSACLPLLYILALSRILRTHVTPQPPLLPLLHLLCLVSASVTEASSTDTLGTGMFGSTPKPQTSNAGRRHAWDGHIRACQALPAQGQRPALCAQDHEKDRGCEAQAGMMRDHCMGRSLHAR